MLKGKKRAGTIMATDSGFFKALFLFWKKLNIHRSRENVL
jgi:hypothetical protein